MRLFKGREKEPQAPAAHEDIGTAPPRPGETDEKRVKGSWYLEHLSEDSRLALQRSWYDEYYEEEGVQGEVGGTFGTKEFERQVKPFFMMLKFLRDLIGQMEDKLEWHEVDAMFDKYVEIRDHARELGFIEGREYLEVLCSRFLKKSGLGLREGYRAERESSEDDFGEEEKEGDGEAGEKVVSEYPEE